MPALSPDPSDETNNLLRLLVMKADNNTLTSADLLPPFAADSNAVTVNCLLYASLTCSPLAAVGAMMAKELLQSFDRTGQTGPLEEQAIFRQRKFDGVQEWRLESVIKFLPNLLLLSVILFFTGVGVFLFPINTAVATTVVAFSGLGVGFSGAMIVAGATSPICPYQSAASNGVRRVSKGLVGLWRMLRWSLVRSLARRTSEAMLRFGTTIRLQIRRLLDSSVSVVSSMRWWYRRSSTSDGFGDSQVVDQSPVPGMQVRPPSEVLLHQIRQALGPRQREYIQALMVRVANKLKLGVGLPSGSMTLWIRQSPSGWTAKTRS